jgi:hypothetical protein
VRPAAVAFTVLAIALSTTACAPVIVKAAIMDDGHLLLNGRPAAGGQESFEMAQASWTHGVVWLYVEGAGHPPGPTAAAQATGNQVIHDVAHHHLMVVFAGRPDFKDLEAHPQFRRAP